MVIITYLRNFLREKFKRKGLPQKDIPQKVRLEDGTIDKPITRKKPKGE